MNRKHPLDVTSGLHCYTCNKPFTKREILYQHYKTVLHQINCKKLKETQSEMPTENQDPEKSTDEVHTTKPYRKLLMEKSVPIIHIKPRPDVRSLRKDSAIIPLESTVQQSDPRKRIDISFIDLVDDYNGDTAQPIANGLAPQPIFVEKNSSLIHNENFIEIGQPEGPQNEPYNRGNEENEEISMPAQPRDLVDLPCTSTSCTFEDTIVPDTFDTISLENFHKLLFGEKESKESKTVNNINILHQNQVDLEENGPLAAPAQKEEIYSFLDYLEDENII